MFGEKSFYGIPKTEPELDAQLKKAQEQIGDTHEFSLVPPAIGREQILHMPVSELRERFARRYQIYLDLLRHKNANDFVGREETIFKMRKWLTALNSLDNYIQQHEAGTDVTLRGKQIDVFHQIRDFLEGGGDGGYIKLPTGYGKTVLFVELIEALDLKTLIVVPTNILVDQTGDKIDKFAPDLDVGRIDQVAKQYGRKVTVTTYASLPVQIANSQLKPEDYECLILDESHEASSEARVATGREFKNAVKLGFSATPRSSELLPTEIYSMPLREAIQDGGLCSVSVVFARTQTDLSKVKINDDGEYSEKELERAVNIVSRNQAAAELYKQAFGGQRAVVYCVGVEHARAAAAEFNKKGIAAAAISGKTNKDEQKRILDLFHDGKIKVLCNADLLIAGFDEPRASLCINLRPTRSRVVAEQRGGRVLRLDEDDPKKHATVVEFLDDVNESVDGPVLFSSILGGAFVGLIDASAKPRTKEDDEDDGDVRTRSPMIDIPGLEVIFDAEEVMRIEKTILEKEGGKKIEIIIDLPTLQAAVRAAGVTSGPDYYKKRKQHLDWPSDPPRLHGWTNWFDFHGYKKPQIIIDLPTLQAAVRAAGVTSADDYNEKYPQYPGWPSTPARVVVGWTNWFDFLGKKTSEIIEDLEQLRVEVMSTGVKTSKDYFKKRSDHPDWPSAPYTLTGWVDWYHFFRRKRKIKDLQILRAAVRAAGIVSQTDYLEKSKQYNWIHNPYLEQGWTNWPDFLGKPALIENLSVLQNAVRNAGVVSSSDYLKKRSDHPDWPSRPYALAGWINWHDFLGKNK